MAMDRRNLLRLLQMTVPCLALLLLGAGEDQLSTTQAVDRDSTIVRITGPQALLDRVAEYAATHRDCVEAFSIGGPGFSIDWGDDGRHRTRVEAFPLGSDGCPDLLQHRYTVPGTYQIKALLYQPSDTAPAPAYEWQSEAVVTVAGRAQPLAFSLLSPPGGGSYLYQASIQVAWTLATGGPIDLTLDLVADNGVVLESERYEGLSYVGRGEAKLHLRSNSYNRSIANGGTTARIRATIVSDSHETLVRESEPISLSAEYVGLAEYRPNVESVAGQALAVTLRHHTFQSQCHDYVIDWGDGTPPENAPPLVKAPCIVGEQWIETTHMYRAAGTYQIVLRTNEHRLHEPAAASPYYARITVTIP
jgi:hypothetical protein